MQLVRQRPVQDVEPWFLPELKNPVEMEGIPGLCCEIQFVAADDEGRGMPAIGGLDLDEAMLAGPLMREDVVAAPVAEPVRHPVQLLEKLNEPEQASQGIGFLSSNEKKDDMPRKVTPEMLSDFGMIPEFVGRLPIIQTLDALDVDALERILTEPKNAVVRQMEAMLSLDGATLVMEPGAVRSIAEQAHKLKTGARGARSIMEELLKDAQFEVPDMNGAVVTVKADLSVSVEGKALKLAA